MGKSKSLSRSLCSVVQKDLETSSHLSKDTFVTLQDSFMWVKLLPYSHLGVNKVFLPKTGFLSPLMRSRVDQRPAKPPAKLLQPSTSAQKQPSKSSLPSPKPRDDDRKRQSGVFSSQEPKMAP